MPSPSRVRCPLGPSSSRSSASRAAWARVWRVAGLGLVALSQAACGGAKGEPVAGPAASATVGVWAPSPSASAAAAAPPPRDPKRLRFTVGAPSRLHRGADELRLGASLVELEAALGRPNHTKYNPSDGSAMSDTTYLSYTELGLSVRTKGGVVEGFFCYLDGAEYDGMVFSPCTPELPQGVSAGMPLAAFRSVMGAPTRDKPTPVMKWVDLEYEAGGSKLGFHFEEGVLSTVKLQTLD